jgi:phage gpG-like protein
VIRIRVVNTAGPSLNRVAKGLGDTEPVNRRVSIQLYGWVMRNFDSEGRDQSPPWPALSARTLAEKLRKGYSPKPLIRTGNLRQSFAGFYDRRAGGVGAKASFFPRKGGGNFDYAIAHEFGTDTIPQRQMLPTDAKASELALAVYNDFVRRQVA